MGKRVADGFEHPAIKRRLAGNLPTNGANTQDTALAIDYKMRGFIKDFRLMALQTSSTSLRFPHVVLPLGLMVALAGGCSEGPGDEVAVGSGGQASTGGGPGSGGAMSGGAPGSGGQSSGGSASGGAPSTGGLGNSGGGPGSGGAATGGGDAGTGGQSNSGFSPCPAEGACKVLPLGDSITVGLQYDGGYRVELFRLAHAAGHDITFTGTQPANGPSMVDGVTFPRNHEGISGETIEQIAGRVPSPGLTEMPHIILVHAGTNDMWNGPQGSDTRLAALMDELIDEAPDALLVFSTIVPWDDQATNVAALNSKVEGLVDERAEQGAHIIFVDQFTDFPDNGMSSDGIHPAKAGYDAMATKWYEGIESYLP